MHVCVCVCGLSACRYGQLPSDFFVEPDEPGAAGRWEEGRRHLLTLVQVCFGGEGRGGGEGRMHLLTLACIDTLAAVEFKSCRQGTNCQHTPIPPSHTHRRLVMCCLCRQAGTTV